jgi:hypothetical protein
MSHPDILITLYFFFFNRQRLPIFSCILRSLLENFCRTKRDNVKKPLTETYHQKYFYISH